MESPHAQFQQAVKDAEQLADSITKEDSVKLYAYYNQATIGNNNYPIPGILDFTGRARWYAWNDLRGMTAEEAEQMYIDLVESLKPNQ
ncbi:hypothetical protein BGW41_002347 [Actinomortierella wolfii]|nr:hypothetical protein BGW41_002347 [Actinomortierella wolfii]